MKKISSIKLAEKHGAFVVSECDPIDTQTGILKELVKRAFLAGWAARGENLIDLLERCRDRLDDSDPSDELYILVNEALNDKD